MNLDLFLWAETLLLIILLVSPSISFIFVGWRQRQQEILTGIRSDETKAIKLYFKQFHPEIKIPKEDVQYEELFKTYYLQNYGIRRFYVPLVLLILTATLQLVECREWLLAHSPLRWDMLNEPEALAVSAVLGAYLWTLNDQIIRWWYASLSPSDLYWAAFRFAFSAPAGYALSRVLPLQLGLAVAYFLGAFPKDTILLLMRKLARSKLILPEAAENVENELQFLQGVDVRTAELFAREGITTISQLAYCDPIRLTIRTNLGYSYIVDCVSQALLWIFAGNNIYKWRNAGIRGAFEVETVRGYLDSDKPDENKRGSELVTSLAKSLNADRTAILNTIEEVAKDPYTQFIYTTWITNQRIRRIIPARQEKA